MRITHEVVEGEEYIDILLSKEELLGLKDGFLLSEDVKILGKKINVGVGLLIKRANHDAAKEREKSKSDPDEHQRDDEFGTSSEAGGGCGDETGWEAAPEASGQGQAVMGDYKPASQRRELTRGTHGPRCACGAGFLEPPGDTMLQCDWCTKTVPVESA